MSSDVGRVKERDLRRVCEKGTACVSSSGRQRCSRGNDRLGEMGKVKVITMKGVQCWSPFQFCHAALGRGRREISERVDEVEETSRGTEGCPGSVSAL